MRFNEPGATGHEYGPAVGQEIVKSVNFESDNVLCSQTGSLGRVRTKEDATIGVLRVDRDRHRSSVCLRPSSQTPPSGLDRFDRSAER